MLGEGLSNKINHFVPLSNYTVSRRIDEMAADVESKLIKFLKEGKFELQIDKSTVIDNKDIVLANFDIHKSNIGRKELMQFPTLKKCSITDIEILENKILIFTDHLDQLKTDMESRCRDLMKLEIPDWILDPFSYEIVDKLTSSLHTYPQLWKQTEPLLISFPSAYLVERGFTFVVQLLTKQRNRLDIYFIGNLRLNLMNIKQDIQALTENHQAQVMGLCPPQRYLPTSTPLLTSTLFANVNAFAHVNDIDSEEILSGS
ncbi:uncharacterized protein [Parasteatoda tepidariorum]|uniref:uncharacterized protein n=1 Tax=Parasteatoda tepidariorum TaxID=114398 RepID=UPI0039BD547F